MAANSPRNPRLAAYRDKRDPDRTPEPFGSGSVGRGVRPRIFVVQKHAASRLHYDFRLEHDGVLLSWAVPRGPCLDPGEKRLAVAVEDHPLDYAEFEGVIPEGSYGAGSVVVWDRGRWEPEGDVDEALAAGDLKFSLSGYKLRGAWVLVRTGGAAGRKAAGKPGAGDASSWLLIKKRDDFATTEPPAETSVLSGLRVEELTEASERARSVTDELDAAGAPRRTLDPRRLKLALCETAEAPHSRPGWLYELKYDGFRLVGSVRDGVPLLRYRGGRDATSVFPDIAVALRALPYDSLVIDGEVVVFDGEGKSDFALLQQRALLVRKTDVDVAAIRLPATLIVFDLLELNGRDVRGLPLSQRKRLLRELLPDAGPLRYCDHIPDRGEDFYRLVVERGLEGVVAKRAEAPYPDGRSPDWLKMRPEVEGDFAVIGYRPTRRASRVGFRSLHLAVRDGDAWRYAGRVGSGFDDTELRAIRDALDALTPADYDLGDAELRADDVWVEPKLVAVVRYKEWRRGRAVRQPSFVRLRHDKSPAECVRHDTDHADSPEPTAEVVDDGLRQVQETNRDKVFWPDDGVTKGDLIDYYRAVAPWLMPYLADRPLVLTRYPDGIAGKSFYQKSAPTWVPSWIRTKTVWSEHSQRDVHYFVCDDVEALIYLVNLGTIPIHVWSSRVSDLAHPDWCILDLDPKEAPFSSVVKVARAIRDLCADIELPCYPKTSGSSGLHILVPLGGQCTYEQSRQLALLIGHVIAGRNPEVATMERVISRRGDRVYIDALQNRHGQLLVAPLSARPLPGAPVSMPLRWREVGARLSNQRFTIRNAPRRLKRLGEDPLAPVLGDGPDLVAVLERLQQHVAETSG